MNGVSVTTEIRVLLIEDNPSDAKLVEVNARKIHDLEIRLRVVTTMADAEQALADEVTDAILLDLGLAGPTGPESVQRLVQVVGDRPVIVLSGLTDESAVIQSLEFGAQDYLSKDLISPEMLRKTLLYAIRIRGLLSCLIRNYQELTRLQRTKDDFLEIIAHKLKAPLTTIFGYLTLLEDHLKGRTAMEPREYLSVVRKNANQFLELTNELFDLSRLLKDPDDIRSTRVSVRPILEKTLSSFASPASDIFSRFTLAPYSGDDPGIYADPRYLEQALCRLLSNALNFSGPDRPIHIGYSRETRNGRIGILIWVKDEGEGISEANRERIFDNFYQSETHTSRTAEGLGLGLAAAKRIMDMHGGQIWAESTLGIGSTFYLFFPYRTIEV